MAGGVLVENVRWCLRGETLFDERGVIWMKFDLQGAKDREWLPENLSLRAYDAFEGEAE